MLEMITAAVLASKPRITAKGLTLKVLTIT